MKTITSTIYPALALVVLTFVVLLPRVQAVSPPADGCYPNLTTAEGCNALKSLTTGSANTGLGWYALFSNIDKSFNTAVGAGALVLNSGDQNTAVGAAALLLNTTGFNNTAVGVNALVNNTGGFANTAVGAGAGPNVIVGMNNTYVGDFVGTLSSEENSTIRIGDLSNGNGSGSLECYIGGIFNNFQPVGGSVVPVTLDLANDHLGWDNPPSQDGSAPAPRRSASLLRSAPDAPRHQAMLNDKVAKLQATVAQQQKQIENLTAQLREQAAQIQKVSAQLAPASPSLADSR